MTEQPDHKTQHRLRAQLLREGNRTLGAAAMTDYRAAKPTHKPRPAEPAPAMTAEERTDAYRAAIAHATTPAPLPTPDTAAGLLARLNARHKN